MKQNKRQPDPLPTKLPELLQKYPRFEGSAFLFRMRKGERSQNMAMNEVAHGMGYKNLHPLVLRSTLGTLGGENTSHPQDRLRTSL